MSVRNRIKNGILICLIIVMSIFVLSIAVVQIHAAENSAPTWTASAVKEDTKTITMGNPYTPAQYITNKWMDSDGDKLTYYYSINDGEPQLCADYLGSEGQLNWFAYTFNETGVYTLKIWVNDGFAKSEPYIATVTVVDPDTYIYTMTIKVAPQTANVSFYECNGYDENGCDVPGKAIKATSISRTGGYHTYELKAKAGIYSFRGTDSAGTDLGGMTFQVPNESKTAGSSETLVCIREVDIGCSTQYDDTHYCTQEHFMPYLSRSGHNAVLGDAYMSSDDITFYRTMLIAAGNDLTYQRYLRATPEIEKLGYTDSGAYSNYTVTPGSSALSVLVKLSKIKIKTFKTPENADVRVFFQRNYYGFVDNTERWLLSKESSDEGICIWKFSIPSQVTGYSWRVSKKGEMTRAGFFSGPVDVLDLTAETDCVPDSTTTTAGSGYIDNSILLNINSQNVLSLSDGDEFILKPYRAWQIVNDPGINYIVEPDFHTEIIKGDDIVEIHESSVGNASGNRVKITAKKDGLAVIRVYYDAIQVSGIDDSGVYGACDKEREGTVIIQVGERNVHKVVFGISGGIERNTEWDAEFDTCYFLGESGRLYMKPRSDDGIKAVSVAAIEQLNFSEIEKQNDIYTIPIKKGNNIIKVTTTSGEDHYQIVKGCQYSFTITNITRSGEKPAVGDTVKIHLNGLYMPVPKMAGVYNPGYQSTGKTIFINKDGTIIQSLGSQYDFISNQDLTITVLGYCNGEYTLADGYMSFSIMAAPNCLGLHRSIPDGGLNTMFNAISNAWRGSTFEDIAIPVSKTGHGLLFTGMIEGSEISLVNSEGLKLIPDEANSEFISFPELPDGEYDYSVTCENYGAVTGKVVLSSEDSGQKEIKIEQKLNDQDVQSVIDAIKALPEAGMLTKEDVDTVDAAKAGFDALSDAQRGYINRSLKDKLDALVYEVRILKDYDVMNVIGLIKSLPDVSNLTLDNTAEVEESNKAYNALTDEQKGLVGDTLAKRLSEISNKIAALITEKENQDAADIAEQYIRELPALDAMMLSDKDKVEQAKVSYDSLSRQQKALVSDSLKLKLQDSVNKIKELQEQAEREEQDRVAADGVEQQISNLPVLEAMTLEDKTKVEQARKAFDGLTDNQETLVSSEAKAALRSAEDRIKELEAQAEQAEREKEQAEKEKEEAERQKAEQEKKDKAVANGVEQQISSLPALNAMTLEDKTKVEQVRESYDGLTDDQKTLVSSETKAALRSAEDRIKELEAQAEQAEREKEQAEKEKEEAERQKAEQEKKNKAAADRVEQQISSLPALKTMTLEDKTNVEQAREAYDSLTDDQKALVSSEAKAALRSAEDRIKELETQAEQAEKEKQEAERQKAEQEKKDKSAAEEAEKLIAQIPALDVIKLEDKDKVEQARMYYNSLTDIQKSLVPFGFHAILVDAENRIIELEQVQTAKAYKVKIKAKALKGHKVKITWKKLSVATGYKVYRATKKKGKYTRIKTLKSPKKVSFLNKKLKKNKYYYYRVIPYTEISGKAYTGKWSNVVRIKAK